MKDEYLLQQEANNKNSFILFVSKVATTPWGDVMSLSPTEVNYVQIVSTVNSPSFDSHISKTSLDMYSQSPWLGALESSNPLAETFLANEGIMEIMSLKEPPCIDTHHHSSFLPHQAVMSTAFKESSSPLFMICQFILT